MNTNRAVITSLALILVLISFVLSPINVQASHRPLPAPQIGQQAADWTATVVVARLNVRRAPRVTSSILGKLNLDDKITLTGRIDNGAWLQMAFGDGFGWVANEFVRIDSGLSRFGLPVTNVFPPYLTVTAEPTVNVRMGPSELYPMVTRLPSATDVDVIAVHSQPVWYQIAMPDNGPIGWVRGDTVEVTGSLSSVPQGNGFPMAQVTSYRVHLHSDPALSAPVLGDVGLDEFYQIVGMDSHRNWWQIDTPLGTGWILAEFVKVIGSVEGLPEQPSEPIQA